MSVRPHGTMILGVLVAILLVSCNALEPRYNAYGADLEARSAARAFIWPADEEGETFRFVVEPADGTLIDEPVGFLRLDDEMVQLSRSTDQAAGEKIAGATVVLPSDASEASESHARQLLDRLEADHDAISIHLVHTAVQWIDVETKAALAERIREAQELGAGISAGGLSPLFGDLLLATLPNYIIVPKAGADSLFLMAGNLHDEEHRPLLRESTPLDTPGIDTLASIDVIARVTEPRPETEPRVWVCLIFPQGIPEEHRRTTLLLALELLETDDPGLCLVSRSSATTYEVLTDRDALATHLKAIVAETNLWPGENEGDVQEGASEDVSSEEEITSEG